MNKSMVAIGIIFIISGILLGAFGSHSLKQVVSSVKLASFETGVRYQLFQGLGLIVIGLQQTLKVPLKSFLRLNTLGTILFSCSIYLLTFSEYISLPNYLIGPLTPIGGSMMILAWSILLIKVLRKTE